MIRTAAVSITAGIIILHYLPVLPPSGVMLLGPIALLCLLFVKQRYLRVLAFCVIGFTWAHFQAYSLLKHNIPEAFIGKDITVTGYVSSLPDHTDRKQRFEFDIDAIHEPDLVDIAPARVRLSWYQTRDKHTHENIQVGDKWKFTIRLKPPRNFANPGGFNYSGWLLQKKILSTGYIRSRSEVKLIESDPLAYPVQRVRQYIRSELNAAKIDPDVEPFLRALVIGDRSDMKTDDWVVLKNTGTVHLMAISGLHIGLIAALMFFIARVTWSAIPFLTLRFAAPRAAAIVAWASALLYAALAGFSLPTQRALIMLSIILLSLVLKKTVKPSIVFSTAVLLVLLLDSFAVLSVSFWLSFGAVALIYFVIHIQSTGQYKIKRWLVLQLIISLGLLPLTIQFFQQAPVISPVANLVAVPVVGFVIVPLSFIATVILLVHEAAGVTLFKLTAQLFTYLWDILKWLAELPISSITFSTPGLITLVFACAGLLLLLLPAAFRIRVLAVLCLLPLLFPYHARPPVGEAAISLLDVGQGLAMVVQTKQHALVFDTGPRFSQHFDTGRAVVLPFLNEKGIRKLDTLMISHGDNDHIGGADSLLSALQVNTVITSVPDKLKGDASRCERGQVWHWDKVKFEVLHPAAADYLSGLSENNLSCVLKITTNQHSFLLTGDIETEAETLLIEREADKLVSHFLIAPHHGSKTSSSSAFISSVKPQTILIPAGWRNRYRFPHQSVLTIYANHGSEVLTTAERGAITIQSETAEISSFNDQSEPFSGHYWDRP